MNKMLSYLDLAAAWENVGEVKSAVSEIQTILSGFHSGRLGWLRFGGRSEQFNWRS